MTYPLEIAWKDITDALKALLEGIEETPGIPLFKQVRLSETALLAKGQFPAALIVPLGGEVTDQTISTVELAFGYVLRLFWSGKDETEAMYKLKYLVGAVVNAILGDRTLGNKAIYTDFTDFAVEYPPEKPRIFAVDLRVSARGKLV